MIHGVPFIKIVKTVPCPLPLLNIPDLVFQSFAGGK
jgi:hypothetical protein